jgi:hypothetical protein
MIFLSFGNTRSGLPGRSATCSRNLCPHARAILLTRSSGFVSLLRMSAIRLLRSVRVSVSIPCGPTDVISRRHQSTTSSNSRRGKSYTAEASNARQIFAFSSPWLLSNAPNRRARYHRGCRGQPRPALTGGANVCRAYGACSPFLRAPWVRQKKLAQWVRDI